MLFPIRFFTACHFKIFIKHLLHHNQYLDPATIPGGLTFVSKTDSDLLHLTQTEVNITVETINIHNLAPAATNDGGTTHI